MRSGGRLIAPSRPQARGLRAKTAAESCSRGSLFLKGGSLRKTRGGSLWDVCLEPFGEIWRLGPISGDDLVEALLGLICGLRVPDLAHLRADALADLPAWRMVDGVLGEVKLASPPDRAPEWEP